MSVLLVLLAFGGTTACCRSGCRLGAKLPDAIPNCGTALGFAADLKPAMDDQRIPGFGGEPGAPSQARR